MQSFFVRPHSVVLCGRFSFILSISDSVLRGIANMRTCLAAEHGNGLILNRPALQKVTQAVLAGEVDVVLVHSLTRIGREWGMTQSYIDQLTRHKVKLLCIKERCLFSEKGVTYF